MMVRENSRAGQTHRPVVMSVLDQFGDDPRPILEVALEQATPNRISKAWVRHRIEEVIGQLSTVLDDDQIEDMVQAFTRKGLI